MNAFLVILPSAAGTPAVAPATRIAGLPLLRRIVLTAERAGLIPLLAPALAPEIERCLDGTTAAVLAPESPRAMPHSGRLVFLPASVIPRADWLATILALPLDPARLYGDGATVAVIETADAHALLARVSGSASLAGVASALEPRLAPAPLSADSGGRFALTTAGDVPAAERWLLRGLIKANEGFMSRHVERRISLAITRRLCATRITPNHMTLVSLAVGLIGAPFFLSAAPGYQVAGALLFLAHSILDGCDGELARLKFLESRWGAVLDVVGDNAVHSVVFACMAIGWSRHSGSPWPLALGAVAVASTLAVAYVVHGRGMRASTGSGPGTALSRVADQAVYRDFIYLILILAALGRAWWFLALTGVGAPIFLILLGWLGRRR